MNFLKPTLVALALVSVWGCQEKAAEATPVSIETEQQKQSYSLGASVGSYLKANLEKQAELGVPLDDAYIVSGLQDSLADKAQMTEEEIRAVLIAMEETLKINQQVKIETEAVDSLAKGAAFLAENAKKDGVTVTESGLQYVVLTAGEGDKPKATDTVKVHYKGTLTNGDVFDSSYERGEPATFPLNRVIAGWTEGVQLMSPGAKFKFTIPADIAYGPNGNPPTIPGNAVLEFEVELLEIQKAEEPVTVGE